MKRKKVIKLARPENMSVADVLVVMQQTITVTMVMQKGIDPNEAYDEWESGKDNILACIQVVQAILAQHGDTLSGMDLSLPDGLALGGYHVADLDFLGRADNLPF